MENLEEEAQETLGVASTTNNQTTTNAIDFDLTPGVGSILSGTTTNSMPGGALEQDFDDSLILIQPRIDVVDLTTSPSTSTSAGTGATLLKPKIEDPSGTKDNITTSNTTTITTTENPSTSTGASTDGVAATTTTNSITSNLLECPICLQTCIHPARLPCGHIFCFLCVKGVAYKNRRCAMCRREIPPEFLDHPQLVNGIEDICTTKATDDGYQWFYEGRNGWWQYDDRTSQDLEEAFKKGERSCTILVAGYVYIVDFDAMIQQRQNEPARCRRVKRDLATIPKKGVAGLRIEGNTVTTDSNFAQQVYRQNRYHNDDLDIHENALLGAHAMDPSNTQGPLRLSYDLGRYVINPSEFVSTAAATDAALRIASDIIGSTLAHADELTRSTTSNNTATTSSSAASSYQPSTRDLSLNPATGELNLSDLVLANNSQQQQRLNPMLANVGGHQMPTTSTTLPRERGSRELLGAAEDLLGATQRVIASADQPTIDLFEQTLNDFHALTLRNIVDSSDEDGDGLHHHPHPHLQQNPPSPHTTPPSSTSNGPPNNGQRSSSALQQHNHHHHHHHHDNLNLP
ncbi:E3 ubiquitin-protein ligase RNF146 isoform X1 [Stomoxys calcitrans]|uniref:E3 ubiquitin-protein ligase RNF146 isoform X1 n=1 Tax=Stomoxys calcitrans TaxID=35570 RepID=UPI0027E292EB|nr:E3 ubiquitin-protein ligase RNF146 isoform X1 [Stomoxys calcitrans]